MDQARKTLWGVGSGPQRAGTFDPYEHLYSLVRDASRDAYSCTSPDDLPEAELSGLLGAFSSFIRICPSSFLINALRQIQDGVVVWIEDEQRKVFASVDPLVAQSVLHLWSQILDQLTELPHKDSSLLTLLQPLMVAGFVSPSRAVVNRTIAFWNECFGEQDTLRYPSNLENVLRAARPYVELGLPDFPETGPGAEAVDLPAFSGPQDQDTQGDVDVDSSSRWTGLLRGTASPLVRTAASHNASSGLATIHTGGTNSGSKASSKGTTPKARLRHDDSQIMFAPIDSSPLPAADDSQVFTDHQKEVRARQIEGAQMFPDISSTPVRKSSPRSRRKAPGPLDFSNHVAPQAADNTVAGTPQDMEMNSELSGYMGSSPTPRRRSSC